MKISETKQPKFRQLWGYAFDPSLSLSLDTDKLNKLCYKVNWEDLELGPCGEYLEIIDYDPTVEKFYTPVDLDDKLILAENGLEPSVSNPQFHQQMVYAVSMTTIKNFEKALGRKVMWSPKRVSGDEYEEYVQCLRIYPHAMRATNAYYSPLRKSILFGYFNSMPSDKVLHMPNSLVFTCLSHDIIAHEVTHAILDGIYGEYGIPTNADMLAFHEAFADIVALFQHFSFPEVVKFEIERTQGRLGTENLLSKLAVEMGSAIGGYGSLRDAIGRVNKDTGEWEPKQPDPEEINRVFEPHARGSILVAAVFDAFLSIYRNRIKDLIRIASNGRGILDEGAIHPDLANRLAGEASKSARHVLHMCIRALDYCPPVDLNFGDYLRAIISADIDLMKEDNRDYRLAFIDAFRRRGIYPDNIKALGIETLKYPDLNIRISQDQDQDQDQDHITLESNMEGDMDSGSENTLKTIIDLLRDYAFDINYIKDRKEISVKNKYYKRGLHQKLRDSFSNSESFTNLTGMAFLDELTEKGIRLGAGKKPRFKIDTLRMVSRIGPDGGQIKQVIFAMHQYVGVRIENDEIISFNVNKSDALNEDSIIFQAACSFIFDLDNFALKYLISKPLVQFDKRSGWKIHERARDQFKYQNREMAHHIGESRLYFGNQPHEFAFSEPFAFLHHH